MKRSNFSDERVIGILREREAGMATAEVCRHHRISPATFYKVHITVCSSTCQFLHLALRIMRQCAAKFAWKYFWATSMSRCMI
jgi:putative transposase